MANQDPPRLPSGLVSLIFRINGTRDCCTCHRILAPHTLMLAILPLLLQAVVGDNECCNPCQDCLQEVDVLQDFNNLYAPLSIGDQILQYSALPYGQASNPGQDGWFNSTTAAPYSIVSNEVFGLYGGCHEFIVQAVLTFSSQLLQGEVTSPLGFNQDPMYGAGFFGVVEEGGPWTFAFLLTNTRVYAMIRFQPTTPPTVTNNVRIFTYLVPVACRRPKDINQYRLILRPGLQTVWFQRDSKDLLRICHPGRPPLSPAFLVAEGGSTPQNGFPFAVRTSLGLMVQPRGWPHGVCQKAIFNQETDNIYTFNGCGCEYAPWQDPTEYLIGLKLRYFELQVLQTFCGKECPGPCCAGCDYDSNPCNIPRRESSSSDSSSDHPCRRQSSSSSDDCNPVRTPSQRRLGNNGCACNRDQGGWSARQLQIGPSFHTDSSSYSSDSSATWKQKPVTLGAAWFGAHAREARRRKQRRARLVAHNYVWPN